MEKVYLHFKVSAVCIFLLFWFVWGFFGFLVLVVWFWFLERFLCVISWILVGWLVGWVGFWGFVCLLICLVWFGFSLVVKTTFWSRN